MPGTVRLAARSIITLAPRPAKMAATLPGRALPVSAGPSRPSSVALPASALLLLLLRHFPLDGAYTLRLTTQNIPRKTSCHGPHPFWLVAAQSASCGHLGHHLSPSSIAGANATWMLGGKGRATDLPGLSFNRSATPAHPVWVWSFHIPYFLSLSLVLFVLHYTNPLLAFPCLSGLFLLLDDRKSELFVLRPTCTLFFLFCVLYLTPCLHAAGSIT